MIRLQVAPLELQAFVGSAGYRQDAPLELHNPVQQGVQQVCRNHLQRQLQMHLQSQMLR